MQKIVIFIEPCEDAWFTPLKIGNSIMNRFAIDEDPAFEVLKIFELDKTSTKMSYSGHFMKIREPGNSKIQRCENSEYKNFIKERKQKGMDLIISIDVIRTLKVTVIFLSIYDAPGPSQNVPDIWC